MKTNHVVFIILLGLVMACQKEETPDTLEQQDLTLNWKTVNPEKVFGSPEDGFNISKDALKQALSLPNVSTVRFILEVENEQLQIRVAGVNPNGDITKGVLAKPVSLQKEVHKLFTEKSKQFETTVLSKAVASHVLQPNDAVDFVSTWQQKIKGKSLQETVAYDGERIQYFSMPAEAIEHMLESRSKSINLVWGVNPKGKFTTVFLPEMDKDGKELLKSGEFIYEYLRPCPPTCTPPE
ncbi:hypothetical protein [Aquimarina algiphila]|uniref:hypothetical protein n=1 Tax=Aquimarina algiphila TaxID=2047982 RepID=UPI002330EA3B|nr:hypothetical protein [Aquimarina algiphila]